MDPKNRKTRIFPLIWIEFFVDDAHCPLYMSSSSPAIIGNKHPPDPKHRKKYMFPLIRIPSCCTYCSFYMPPLFPPRIRNGHFPDPKHRTKSINTKYRKKWMMPLIRIKFFPDGTYCSMYMPILSPSRIKNWRPPVPKQHKKNKSWGNHCSLIVHAIDPFDWSSRFSWFNWLCYKYRIVRLV